MLNSAIVEVIVGLIFVYSLMSILVTQINTVIGNVVNLRARHLKEGLRELITDPETQARLLTHPLISLVRRPLNPDRPLSAQGAQRVTESETTDIAYVEPRVFAEVLTDILQAKSSSERDLFAPLTRIANTVLNNAERAKINALIRNLQSAGVGFNELRNGIATLSDPADRQALLQAFNEVELETREFRTDSGELIALLRGIRNVQNQEFRRALHTMLNTARDLQEAQARLELWFDNHMVRVSSTFKRTMQYVSLGIGLALTLLLNVDTLSLAQSLWNDPAIRETVVTAARASLESGELADQIQQSQATPIPQAQGADMPEETIDDAQEKVNVSIEKTQATLENLLALRLPIGWAVAPVDSTVTRNPLDPDPYTDARNLWNFSPLNNPYHWLGLWIRKIIGLLVTMIAVSQGAPFWFDLLNKIARPKSS